ncbi:MAG TPA: aminoacyl-tRNA hydrolase [Actinomycetota bacterium]|nr:aminoacyl-tRNA hydrolase [Actinomycetota bacterium]
MDDPWLIAGLGNPEERYAKTRHNVGAMVVDRLCARLGVTLRKVRFVAAAAADARAGNTPVVIAKATTYMNESGPPLGSLARKRGIAPDHVIAVHDELDLPFGALRLKFGGSTAGHHGLDSLASGLRTPGFYRVRVGIGRPPGRQDPVDFVLSPFGAREREELDVLVEDAAGAAIAIVTGGLDAAQSTFNRGAPPKR